MKAKNKRSHKKRSALLTSILLVLAALAYMILGEDLAKSITHFDYSRLYRHFTATIPDGQIEVHVIDVGQGDCTLVRSPDGNILIDAGPDGAEQGLLQYLTTCGVETLDYFICTHPHEDHIGGADRIVESFEIGRLLMTDATAEGREFEQLCEAIEAKNVTVEIPEAGESYTLGDVEFRVLAPVTPSDELNDMSLVVRLTFGATAFLFTGDAEAASERNMLDTYNRLELGSDFLKLGHHGSDSSTTAEFLAAVSPSIAAISCGRDNDYGHPHSAVLKRLDAADIDIVLRTDTEGSIVIISDGAELSY